MPRAASLLLLPLLLLLAAACGGDDDDNAGGPPALEASAGGESVGLGLGSSCWTTATPGLSVCRDVADIPLDPAPLAVARGDVVSLSGDLPWSALEALVLDAAPGAGPAAVPSDQALPLVAGVGTDAATFAADLPPGSYVVRLFIRTGGNDALYAFLLEVAAGPGVGLPAVALGEEFSLRRGAGVAIEATAWSLTFTAVSEDSRCASDVTCVWAGQAVVLFTAIAPTGEAQELRLVLGTETTVPQPFGRFGLLVSELRPYPVSTAPIGADQYEVTARVLPLDPGAGAVSGMEGRVTRGPICPVARADLPCPDAPYAATLVVRDGRGVEVGRVTAAADGRYRLALPAGVYTVDPLRPPGQIFPVASPVEVSVAAAGWTSLDISYDTGIR